MGKEEGRSLNHNRLLHFLMAQGRFCRIAPTGADIRANMTKINTMLVDMPEAQPAYIYIGNDNGKNARKAMKEIIRRNEIYKRNAFARPMTDKYTRHPATQTSRQSARVTTK